MNTDELKRFVALEKRRRELEAEIESIKTETTALERGLLAEFEHTGTERISIDGATVYVERKLWARAKDGDKSAVCAALKRADLGDFVEETFNTNTLSAYVRELERDGETLPHDVKAVVEVSEVFKLRTRRS